MPMVGEYPRQETALRPDVSAWWRSLLRVNTAYLFHPPLIRLRWRSRRDPINLGKYIITQYRQARHAYDWSWYPALNLLGLEWAHRFSGEDQLATFLQKFFDAQVDRDGRWRRPPQTPAHCMKGYSLLYLARITDDPRYAKAAQNLVDFLLSTPRTADNSLEYTPGIPVVLVDTLGMVCPLLARAAVAFDLPSAAEFGAVLLDRFSEVNLDPETALPYHGYFPQGPKRLGLQGWGRGVGWYIMGLADFLAEAPRTTPLYDKLAKLLQRTCASVREHQRPDGHWSWCVPLGPAFHHDSSATAMIGYGLLRGLETGILNSAFTESVAQAVNAIWSETTPRGAVLGSSGECINLGVYSQTYSATPWGQGAALALASAYLRAQA